MSKSQLLAWINEFLGLSYTHIEQTCSGVVALQVMDAIHPGVVPLGKVNFGAKYEYEYARNLKLLQGVFVKVGIEKEVDIEKLTKGKYQDNLEFMQWLKQYFDHNFKGGEYDAVARRSQAAFAVPKERPRLVDLSNTIGSDAGSNGAVQKPATKPGPSVVNPTPRSQSVCPVAAQPSHTLRMQGKVDTLQRQLAEMREAQSSMEKQRDFYYGKLRNIEILLDDDAVLKADVATLRTTIQSILFNTAGDFVCMEDPAMELEH
eukprot:EG_transcript_24591